MGFRLSQTRLMTRLTITAVMSFCAMLLIIWESVSSMSELLYEDREQKTRELVEVAHGVLDHYHGLQKAGTLSEEDAKAQALVAVQALRYSKTEYFWINDLGKPAPKMVMHPTVPSLNGKLLDDAKFNKATRSRDGADGKDQKLDNVNLFSAFVSVVERAGHGYVQYQWPKPLAGGGASSELYPKLSYVKKFAPWGWVIGSGIYVDDVEMLFREHAKHTFALAVLAMLVLLIMAWFVRRSIFAEFGGEPMVARKITSVIAEGDLTHPIRLQPNDQSSVLYVLGKMQDNLRDMLRNVILNARQVESSIEQLSAESNEINLATQLQASVIEQTRHAIDGVSSSVAVVSGLAHETSASSQEVVRRARAGADVAEAVAREMQVISNTVSTSSLEVAQLVERTREIDTMASVIKEIADQTNLLALNAAIEAARAGEQGRGFAVVADEVRKLAERTGKATTEIAGILKAIQEETERAVRGMNAATPVIAQGVEKANDAAGTLREIENQSLSTQQKMSELVEATEEQTARISEIVGNVNDVMSASTKTEEVIRESLKTAANLERAASNMFGMVKRFNIGDAADGPRSASGDAAIKPLIEWSNALSVGHPEIDRQHKILIEIANRMSTAMRQGAGREATGKVLHELVDYTVNHFAWEERLMNQHGYRDKEAHLREHKMLIDRINGMLQQFDGGNTAISGELLNLIRDWLINHILKVDKALSRDLSARGLA